MCPPQCPPGPNSGPPGPGPGSGPVLGPGSDPFYPPPFSPYNRRLNHNCTDLRIHELNKRLQNKPEECDNVFWDNLTTDFFEEDATLTLILCLEDGIKRFTIGRTLIPRYFRSLFEGGVTDLSFNLRNPKESYHNSLITLDCEQCSMITYHGKFNVNKTPMGNFPPGVDSQQVKDQMHITKETSVVVNTEGRLTLEFTNDDLMRIKSWLFNTRSYQELVPRNLINMYAQDPSALERFSKDITRQGFTNATLNYLRLCLILEPMQELMASHKKFGLDPRDSLKQTLYAKWQKTVTDRPDSQRPVNKRRKRKSSASNNANGGGATGKKKNNTSISPGPPSFSLASQDVMVVGEPSMMGGEFGDEDERTITRLENSQYDPNASGVSNGLEDGDDFNSLSRAPGSGQGPVQGPNSGSGPGPGQQGNLGQPHGANIPPTGWSGPGGPGSNSGPVSSNQDNRGNNQGGSGPQSSQVDKKPSPLN